MTPTSSMKMMFFRKSTYEASGKREILKMERLNQYLRILLKAVKMQINDRKIIKPSTYPQSRVSKVFLHPNLSIKRKK